MGDKLITLEELRLEVVRLQEALDVATLRYESAETELESLWNDYSDLEAEIWRLKND